MGADKIVWITVLTGVLVIVGVVPVKSESDRKKRAYNGIAQLRREIKKYKDLETQMRRKRNSLSDESPEYIRAHSAVEELDDREDLLDELEEIRDEEADAVKETTDKTDYRLVRAQLELTRTLCNEYERLVRRAVKARAAAAKAITEAEIAAQQVDQVSGEVIDEAIELLEDMGDLAEDFSEDGIKPGAVSEIAGITELLKEELKRGRSERRSRITKAAPRLAKDYQRLLNQLIKTAENVSDLFRSGKSEEGTAALSDLMRKLSYYKVADRTILDMENSLEKYQKLSAGQRKKVAPLIKVIERDASSLFKLLLAQPAYDKKAKDALLEQLIDIACRKAMIRDSSSKLGKAVNKAAK